MILSNSQIYEMTENDCYSEGKHKSDAATQIGTTSAATSTNRPWIRYCCGLVGATNRPWIRFCCGLMGAFLLFVFLLNIGAIVTLFYYQMKMASEISKLKNGEMLQTNTNRSAGS